MSPQDPAENEENSSDLPTDKDTPEATKKAEDDSTVETRATRRSRFKFLPLIVFIGFTYVADLTFFPLLSNNGFANPLVNLLTLLFTSIILGQAGFAIAIAGLFSKRWVEGLAAATLFGATAISLVISGRYFQTSLISGLDPPLLWSCFALPLVLLASAIPFYVLRYFWGMHWTRIQNDPQRRGRGLEEFLIAMAVVGSCLFLATVPQVAWELRANQYWQSIGAMVFFLATVSALTVLPTVCIVFLIQTGPYRLAAMTGMVALTSLFAALFGQGLVSPPLGPWWVNAIAIGTTPLLYLMTGLIALQISGYRLSRFRTVIPQTEAGPSANSGTGNFNEERTIETRDPFDTSEHTQQSAESASTREPSRDWRSRITAATLLLLAAIGSFATSRINERRTQALVQNRDLAASLNEQGSTIEVHLRDVMRLVCGPQTTNDQLRDFLHLRELRSLDLSNTQVTDAALETINRFTKLRELDLSGTSITGEGLLQLQTLDLQRLSLADTSITIEEMTKFLEARMANGISIQELDLSNQGWTFDQLKSLPLKRIPSLALRGYGLTDQQLLELVTDDWVSCPEHLDVRNNNLTGDFLAEYNKNGLNYGVGLKLDDNPLTDQAVGASLSANPITFRDLSLSRTRLTDACLPAFAKCTIESLTLGEGQITEQGLASNGLFIIDIHLNAAHFTGETVPKITQGSYPNVDLSFSGITDESLASLRTFSCSVLDLSHTQISDESLPILGSMPFIPAIDLSHTRVTADGLMRGDLAGAQRVIVAFGQFTDAEIERISRAVNLEVGTVLLPDEEFYLWLDNFSY